MNRNFPFSAVVGQESMKTALLLNAIDPHIGGVLFRGEKGTAKSTLIRSLAAVLPVRESQRGCPYHCSREDLVNYPHLSRDPVVFEQTSIRVVDLPLNISQDRLVGSLDMEAALSRSELSFRPGILAAAHGNLLYIDEVNLLEDHLVDMLLDAAALGENIVEREGISLRHPCRSVMVGSMNPEEGELRPQLLDRFGLVVDVCGEQDLSRRVEIVRRRMAFEDDPQKFCDEWEREDRLLADKIRMARESLMSVEISELMLQFCSRITLEMEVDGHRADLAILRSAKALAAWRGTASVNSEMILEMAPLALSHRMHRKPYSPDLFLRDRWPIA